MKTPKRQTSKGTPKGSRRAQQELRQAAILKAAFEVFAAHGYEAARIEEVAQRAGIAKGTIYLYFRDKEKLFQAVVRNLIPKRFDDLVKTLPGSPADILRALLMQMYANIVTNSKVPFIFRMLIGESGRFPQLAEIYHREIIVPGMKAIRQVVERGVAEGVFRKTSASEFPQILVAPALLSMVWQLLLGKHHPLDLEAYMKGHAEFVLRSLEPERA